MPAADRKFRSRTTAFANGLSGSAGVSNTATSDLAGSTNCHRRDCQRRARDGLRSSAIRNPQSPTPLLNVPLRLVGVIGKLYVLLESDRGLVLLDQHAAHERILFEQMLNRIWSKAAPRRRKNYCCRRRSNCRRATRNFCANNLLRSRGSASA